MSKKMIVQLLLCALVCAALVPFRVSAKDMFAPPAGIAPSNTKLADVLAAARKADGSDRHYSTSVEQGRVTAWGLKGTYREVQSGDDYKSTVDLGVILWQRGRLNGQLWRRNENGLVIVLHDVRKSEDFDAKVIASYLEHHTSDLALLGETAGSDAAYVVELHPQGARRKWLFFDKKSYLMTRVEVPFSDARDTYTYSDFRKTGSHLDAWHVHRSDGITQNDVDYVTATVKYDVAVTSADTAMPPSNDKLVQFPASKNVVELPAKLVGQKGKDRIVTVENGSHDITTPGDMTSTYTVQDAADPKILMQLTIDGHGYDFWLDSGAAGIFIDSDQARKLGLKTFGPSQQTKFGNWVQSYALIPDLHVGEITMTNVIASTLPGWHDDSNVGTNVVGLVGYDFIANAVLTIDYQKGSVTATNPFFFVPPADAMVLPATLDDGVPYIPVQVGQALSDHFVLDTGATNCFMYKSFWEAHPDDVKDQGTGVKMNHIWLPMYGFTGISRAMSVRSTEVKSLTIAGAAFNEWLMFMDLSSQESGDNFDGLIGYDFLKYFTVYLDYPQNQVFLLPNSLARSRAAQR